jgi:hypothetical protein
MDQLGFSTVNTHDGTVFVEGDMNINGNLTVTGTYPGGGGGGSVNNPMTEDLDANNYLISNISELSAGEEGFIKTGSLDLQDNDIINVNEIKGRSDDNKMYITGNVQILEDLDMTDKNINNVGTLDTDIITSSNSSVSFDGKGISNVVYIGSTNGGADTIILNGDIKSNNGNFIDGITNITGYGSGDVLQLNGDIRITTKLDLLRNNIDRVEVLDANYIRSSINNIVRFSDEVQMLGILTVFGDIILNYKSIFNVERITASHATVNLNLDMIPATEGKAGQILARDPAFDPSLSGTHKLVWTNPASGTVTNPMTVSLEAATFSIYNANIVECKTINLMIGGTGISCVNGALALPITWGLALKQSTAPFYQTFNTDYITAATNLGITIDSKAPDGITDSKITLSAPNIILNNSTNLAPSLVSITGNLQITNGNGYIHGNNLIVRGRTAGNVPTDLTIEGITTAINSTTLNITSNANVIVGNTNFTNTVRTNTIDANSGGTISVLQNLILAVGRQVRATLLFSDGLRSNTATDLYVAGLLPDNKTQTNIILASPQISLNNAFGPLTQETQVNIAGSLVFNNPVSNPFIHGSNLFIRGRTPAGVATQLTLEGTTTTINSSTLTIFSSLANNIGGDTNFSGIVKTNNIQPYTGTSINITATDVIMNSLTSTELKTTSIALSSGTIIQTSPLAVNTQLKVNTINPLTNPTILMPSVDFSGTVKTNTIQPYSGTSINITATDTNISNRLNVLTNRSSSIGVRTTIFKTYGPMPNVNINSVTPVKLNSIIVNQKGDNIIPSNGFVNGDKFIITMYGLLTTLGSGNLNFYILIGPSVAVSFTATNVASTAQPAKFTFEIDCTVSGNNVNLSNNTALLSVERFNTSIRFSVGIIGSLIDNTGLSNSIDIYVAQSATQVSNFTPLSYTIEQM